MPSETKLPLYLNSPKANTPTPKTHLFRGRYMTAKEIAAITGKDVNLIHQRVREGRPLDVDRKPGVPPRLYAFGDERLSIKEIAKRTGMSRDQIVRRISGDRIVSEHELATMPRERSKHECLIFYNGECMNISEWSRKLGKNKNTLVRRLHVGWPVHLALTTPSDRYRLRACNRRIIRRIWRRASFRSNGARTPTSFSIWRTSPTKN